MSKENNLTDYLTDLGDAIREVGGGDNSKINPQDFADRIRALPVRGGVDHEWHIFYDNTKPASLYGGTWEELAQGTFLEATGSGGSAGINRDAGLPNITGTLNCRSSSGAEGIVFAGGGAFWKDDAVGTPDLNWQRADAQYGNRKVYFDASKSNSIYKYGVTTVQPKSITAHIWRRVS